jgi:hypothetical protein
VPTYSTDLRTIEEAEGTDAVSQSDNAVGWSELASPSSTGARPIFDADPRIQGTTCVSQQTGNNSTGLEAGFKYQDAANIRTDANWTDGQSVVFIWWNMLFPGALRSFDFSGTVTPNNFGTVTGGMFLLLGTNRNNFNGFNVGGNDKYIGPYGGWRCTGIDPTKTSEIGYTDGNPGTNLNLFGILPNLQESIRRGQSIAMDVIRWGPRGKLTVGGSGSAATLTRLAAYNDQNIATNSDSEFTVPTGQSSGYFRLGLFQDTGASFLWKGQLDVTHILEDSNKTIVCQDQNTLYENFTELLTSGSGKVDLTTVSILAESTDIRQGAITLTGSGSSTFTACTIIDTGDITVSTTNPSTFTGCTLAGVTSMSVTQAAVITNNTFTSFADPAALTISQANFANSTITGNTFTSNGNNHAIQISGTGNITLDNMFSGYSGTSTNAALYATATSGTLNVSIAAGSDTPTVRTNGVTVNILAPYRNFELTGLKDRTEVRLINSDTKTEIAGVENVIGGVGTGINNGGGTVTVSGTTDDNTFNYAYQYSSDVNIDAAILSSSAFEVIYLASSLQDSDKSIPIQQQPDRNYNNPV